jgi:hypothetical protein
VWRSNEHKRGGESKSHALTNMAINSIYYAALPSIA